MSDYPDFTISALLKGLYAGDPKALAVDVHGNLSALIKGWYGTTPTPLQVDQPGNLIAMLKALNVAAPISVQADAGGNLQMTLVAQELDELINRFKLGAPDSEAYSEGACTPGDTSLVSLTGKGYIYSGLAYSDANISHKDDVLRVEMDGQAITGESFEALRNARFFLGTKYPCVLVRYDDVDFTYSCILTDGYTFESGYEVIYENKNAVLNTPCGGRIIYTYIT